jgi:hypothetical protein
MYLFKERKIKQKDAKGLPLKGYLQYFKEELSHKEHKGSFVKEPPMYTLSVLCGRYLLEQCFCHRHTFRLAHIYQFIASMFVPHNEMVGSQF